MALKLNRNISPPSSRSDILTLQDLDFGDHPFRFLEGGDVQEVVRWPTKRWDDEKGELITTWRSVRLSLTDRHTLLDRLAGVEKGLRQAFSARDGRKPRAPLFGRRRTYVYAVFNRSDEGAIKPSLLEITSQKIAETISEFHTKLDDKDPRYLAFGPMSFYDIYVRKIQNPKKAGQEEWQRTRYGTEVRRNEWAGSVPVSYLEEFPEDFDFVEQGVFTQEEWDALSNSDLDIGQHVAPQTDDQVLALLVEFPIDLKAASRDGEEVFPMELREEIDSACMKFGVPLLETSTGGVSGATFEEKEDTEDE